MTTHLETALDRVTNGLRRVVTRQQQHRDPAHEDFYIWGWALSELTMRTQDAGRVLGRQVAAYGDRRILRDDEQGWDPAERLTLARQHLDTMTAALERANEAARLYHSTIGHIAVQVDPAARP